MYIGGEEELTNNPEQELKAILERIKIVANDQNCSVCKEDLELAAKGVEASAIKLGRLNQMAEELEGKKLMDIDVTLREKYVGSNPTPRAASAKETAAGLGINDILLDFADILDDVKEITNPLSMLPTPKLPGMSRQPGGPRKPPSRPPLPHELLLGTAGE